MFAEVLPSLRLVPGTGDKRQGYCPAHDDKSPSLGIIKGKYGKAVLKCYAGCSEEDVLKALGLYSPTSGNLRASGGAPDWELTGTFVYLNEISRPVYRVLAYRLHEGKKVFVQESADGNGGWQKGRNGTPSILYNLPSVGNAMRQGELIYYVEGEKDAETLIGKGFVATTHAGGAASFRPAIAHPLAGAKVVIVPDNDKPGKEMAEAVAATLEEIGCAAWILDLPGLAEKEDVTDWLNAGNSIEDFRGLVERLVLSPAVATPVDLEKIRAHDIGNAQRLVERHGGQIRYCPSLSKWYAWDGLRWRVDEDGARVRLASETIGSIRLEEAKRASTRKEQTALLTHARKSASEPRIRAMISLASADLRIIVGQQELDADPMLLGNLSGTIDLNTGNVREPRKADYVTKLVGAEWQPSSTAPQWLNCLDRLFDGNHDLISFFQRAVGYSLTGRTSEQVLFFLHGQGANGKSLLLSVIKSLLGDYAAAADFTTFHERSSDRPRTDLARLQGRRFVSAIESGEGRRLDEGLIKQLTGEDVVVARQLYSQEFEYRPRFKLWLSANHTPRIRGTDTAIWRRILLIPFGVTIPESERNPALRQALVAELPGILDWAIQGCLSWLEIGLKPPSDVREATQTYRTESDIVGAFLLDCCQVSPSESVRAASLYAAFKAWAYVAGEDPITQTAFGRKLTERGLEAEKRGPENATYRLGVSLNSPEITSITDSYGQFPTNSPNSLPEPVAREFSRNYPNGPATVRKASANGDGDL